MENEVQIRNSLAYNRYKRLYEFIKRTPAPTIGEILKQVDRLIDTFRGYHYNWYANYVNGAVKLVIKDEEEQIILETQGASAIEQARRG